MNINHKLIALGLAFSLLGSASALQGRRRISKMAIVRTRNGRSRIIFRQRNNLARPAMRIVRQLIRIKNGRVI